MVRPPHIHAYIWASSLCQQSEDEYEFFILSVAPITQTLLYFHWIDHTFLWLSIYWDGTGRFNIYNSGSNDLSFTNLAQKPKSMQWQVSSQRKQKYKTWKITSVEATNGVCFQPAFSPSSKTQRRFSKTIQSFKQHFSQHFDTKCLHTKQCPADDAKLYIIVSFKHNLSAKFAFSLCATFLMS